MAALTSLLCAALLVPATNEEAFYTVDYLTPPEGVVLEVGGMDFLPDGRLVLSTRRGQVWLVSNPLASDPNEARFDLFAEGLWEGLGLKVVDGEILVLQRGELSRLRDLDGDGRCDDIETLCDDWGLSGNYHEFAYGLPRDEAGNLFVSLNVSFLSPDWWHGKSDVPWRGWILKIAPNGEAIPIASGLRSPCGLGIDTEGRLLATDNQGDWMPASPVFHVRQGGFYGHPASLNWTAEYQSTQTIASKTIPTARAANDREPAAVWLPYKWSRSPGNLLPDTTAGRFGPFEDQIFVGEVTNGMVLRMQLEEVNGVTQGWVQPFRQKIGAVCRVRFAPDGTLFCGLTNRGWGGLPPADGLARVRWTGKDPFAIHTVSLRPGGFELRFTRPLAADFVPQTTAVRALQYDYDYWWEYGSPERARTPLAVTSLEVGPERRTLFVGLDGMERGRVARVVLEGFVDDAGNPLLHPEFAYTANQLVDPEAGDSSPQAHVAKIVPPPPARKSAEEGWLRMTYGDATDRWQSEGWELCDADLDPDDPSRLKTRAGVGALTNTATDTPTDYVSKQRFGDCKIHLEFMLPEGGETALWIHGRYGLLLRDEDPDLSAPPNARTCGAVLASGAQAAVPPREHAYAGAGQWQKLDLEFRAARMGPQGRRIEPARLKNVRLDDVLLHEEVLLEAPDPERGPESANGPLVLVGDRTHVAFGNIRVRPITESEPNTAGWTSMLDEELAAWLAVENDTPLDPFETNRVFEDDTLIGSGPKSYLVTRRSDYQDFELYARVKISDGGRATILLRADESNQGYGAVINSSFAEPEKSGSFADLAAIRTHLIAPDTWFEYRLDCRTTEGGTRLRSWVNGILFTDTTDPTNRYRSGRISIEQHHEGSVVELQELRVRPEQDPRD